MKTVAVVVVMLGLFMICGCEDTQLVQCQKDNAALKAEVQKAQVQVTAADEKIAQLQKKDLETQNQALKSISAMLEKENTRSKAKEERIKQLEAELAAMKAAAPTPAPAPTK
jgi:septal ring factor EnvC (AmiA/AmiB activator)